MKATLVLFPLLGTTNLLFAVNPADSGGLEGAYMLANALLQSSQVAYFSGTIIPHGLSFLLRLIHFNNLIGSVSIDRSIEGYSKQSVSYFVFFATIVNFPLLIYIFTQGCSHMVKLHMYS